MKIKILYYTGWLLTRIISKLVFRIKVKGAEHFPDSGGFILATNHVSVYDPLLVGSWARRQVYFFAKQELFKNPIFGLIIRYTNALPVRRGAVDRQALDQSCRIISDGYGLTIFPEGTRSRGKDFLSPKPGIGMIALRSKCPIVVGYVHGSNRLADCLTGRERMSLSYGEPVLPEEYADLPASKEGYAAIAELVMTRIADLRERVTGLK